MEAVEQPISVVNMTEICRLCLSEERLGVPIFGGEDDLTQGGAPLSARIMTCASLEVHAGDGLPAIICLRCMYQVDQSYKFRVQCQRSDAALRRHFNVKPSIHQQQHTHHQIHPLQQEQQQQQHQHPQERDQQQTHSQQPPPLTVASGTEALTPPPQSQSEPDSHPPTLPPPLPPVSLHQVVQRGRSKRLIIVREDTPVEVEMLSTDTEQENSVLALKQHEIVVDETSSSSHVSPATDHTSHTKDSCNFLPKQRSWSEEHEQGEEGVTAAAVVVYQHQVNLMKQETSSEADVDDEQHSKAKHYSGNVEQDSTSREEHLLNELNSLGATTLSKSTSSFASAMYNLKALSVDHQYSCEVCGRSFVQNHSLTRHMRTHTGERPYPCPTCGKAFIQNHSLTRHMRTHTGERPFACTTCGRTFAEHHKLKSHLKTHTGERPFSCDTCNKTFIERHTLLDHIKTHTGERNYACAICGKSFMERHKLKRHLRSHTGERPYSCVTCGKSFVQSHNLTQHMRIHTGEQPYPCSTCGKMFGERHKLERHLRSHAKNGPYACPTCGKRFMQSHRLARHVRLHASESHPGSAQPEQGAQTTQQLLTQQQASQQTSQLQHQQQQQQQRQTQTSQSQPPAQEHSPPPQTLLHSQPSLLPLALPLRPQFMKDIT